MLTAVGSGIWYKWHNWTLAEQGHSQGVIVDKAEAVRLYRKAAEQGNADAQFNLSLCYRNGDGVMKDFVEAYTWFLLAAASGHEEGGKVCAELARQLTTAQLAVAQARAKTWQNAHEQSWTNKAENAVAFRMARGNTKTTTVQ